MASGPWMQTPQASADQTQAHTRNHVFDLIVHLTRLVRLALAQVTNGVSFSAVENPACYKLDIVSFFHLQVVATKDTIRTKDYTSPNMRSPAPNNCDCQWSLPASSTKTLLINSQNGNLTQLPAKLSSLLPGTSQQSPLPTIGSSLLCRWMKVQGM